MSNQKIDVKKYKGYKKEYDDLQISYYQNKYAIKDAKKRELEDLKFQYKIDKASIRSPLKAEKVRIKIEKKKIHRQMNEAPRRKLLEEIGNATSHGVGALFGIAALILMLLKANTPLSYTAAAIYGSCIFLQMLFSCLYHSFRGGTKVKRIFRRFDYTSIYLAIGGTLTPTYLIYMINNMWGFWYGISFFAVQWVLIATGITFVAIFGPGRIRPLHYTLYFTIGWSALMFLPFWANDNIPLLIWILSGGVVYTLGMIPFAAMKHRPGAHFIWHIVCLLGTVCMWIGIYLYLF